MRRRRSAKIVADAGTFEFAPDQIRALFEAGVDVFRLNFSHGTRHVTTAPGFRRSGG